MRNASTLFATGLALSVTAFADVREMDGEEMVGTFVQGISIGQPVVGKEFASDDEAMRETNTETKNALGEVAPELAVSNAEALNKTPQLDELVAGMADQEARDLVEAVPDQVREDGVAAGEGEGHVEMGVRVDRLLEARRVAGHVLELHEPAELGHRFRVAELGGPRRRRPFEQPPDLEDVLDEGHGHAGHREPARGHPLHVTLLQQPGQGFAHGCAARAHGAGQLGLGQGSPRSVDPVDDSVLDLHVDLLHPRGHSEYRLYTKPDGASIPALSSPDQSPAMFIVLN